ncbi:hypothetical protein P8C59_006724 [Phyllachora maydis]|uniref:Cytochrome b5 heme-binding domain-containing protein n=1 Tax=Phyllachora maydis TaxID=1825666 RepID=A0AAD9I6Z6_9PEZI|nr:hypothetical protein P8C59_006724 [Phyllachora maydis]
MDYVEQRMAQEAAKQVGSDSLLTPVNLALLAIVAYTVYACFFRHAPAPLTAAAPDAPAIVFRTFTPRSLLPYSGADGGPVYMGVRGRVFDVSRGRNFYGPGGPYENFAGRDASRGLACHRFDEGVLTEDLDGPLDDLADLGDEEMEALRGWEDTFLGKYLVVGNLVAVAQEGEGEGEEQEKKKG